MNDEDLALTCDEIYQVCVGRRRLVPRSEVERILTTGLREEHQ